MGQSQQNKTKCIKNAETSSAALKEYPMIIKSYLQIHQSDKEKNGKANRRFKTRSKAFGMGGKKTSLFLTRVEDRKILKKTCTTKTFWYPYPIGISFLPAAGEKNGLRRHRRAARDKGAKAPWVFFAITKTPTAQSLRQRTAKPSDLLLGYMQALLLPKFKL